MSERADAPLSGSIQKMAPSVIERPVVLLQRSKATDAPNEVISDPVTSPAVGPMVCHPAAPQTVIVASQHPASGEEQNSREVDG